MDKNEKWICWYSSLLIALLVNATRLLALREKGIVARYWQFDFAEYSFQLLYNLAFCGLLFYLNLNPYRSFAQILSQKKYGKLYLLNAFVVLLAIILGLWVQSHLFAENHLNGVVRAGYVARFGLSTLLVAIIVKIILLLRESKRKDNEHEQLKSLYLEAQLELLKEQLNPHLLFNSLSSLSGIVRENPKLAQFYIVHLSKVFRHALVRAGTSLVTIEEELNSLKSYEQLIKMRFENAFSVLIDIDESYFKAMIPHLSLQPLLENAAKHNIATLEKPLSVRIYTEEKWLIVSNNLQEITTPESSTGIGLVNLNERFRLLLNTDIEIEKTKESFTVKLPIKI
ncbi:histidine kinase [Arcicella sp. DC2W]|uniref:Histidine kinase n=1 Tax=Arcicella gelida TaxID=2984195 RepID=A0ABU5S674_9BACT|nr:histidine kinase [Arcicella sp. DC2W]MEA5403957.1 histidine kinase [Arcicella sp. DC2W]